VLVRDRVAGSVELVRRAEPFTNEEQALARLARDYVGLALAEPHGDNSSLRVVQMLRLGGDALAAAADETRTADQIAVLASEGAGARAAVVWGLEEDARPEPIAGHGIAPYEAFDEAAAVVVRAVESQHPLTIEALETPIGGAPALALTVPLGRPPLGVLQLFFERDAAPSDAALDALVTFGARAAQALRASARTQRQTVELERSRALLSAVGQAIAQLSLAHTLETAIDRVAALLAADAAAVYLLEADDERLLAAAGRGLAGPHLRVAEHLLQLSLASVRNRGLLLIEDAADDPRLEPVRDAVAEAGLEAALAIPLLANEELIGLLVVYPERGRTLSGDERDLATALATQLAVAVQNARLHEQAKTLGAEREQALEAERHSARTLRALYEVSRSFAQSLSLEATLDAVVRTVVELLEVDAASISMPDGRGDVLVTRALHVADERVAGPLRSILARPQPLAGVRAPLLAVGQPVLIDPATAALLGGGYTLLVPFLEKGSTVAVLPVSTQAEALGTLTVVSLDPARRIGSDAIDMAASVAGHAALALDNARLYQQQKEFADAMQHSLLPRTHPDIAGLELGDVYASSARVDVGGDVYDFLTLEDGRLAVALGDVTGHGVDAAADMAMAKFVFRSLAREHPAPADFLATANDVVVDEIAANKFITMLYVTIDVARGQVCCASAGHPAPRIIARDGSVSTLEARGLALGIVTDQEYEEIQTPFAVGSVLVLYTDGVLEARREGEQYGEERLDALLARNAERPARELAQAVLEDCRRWSGGDLADDCAVVVIRRTA
jgi:serine phosphatase RsbU (regulator of sigma subunit)